MSGLQHLRYYKNKKKAKRQLYIGLSFSGLMVDVFGNTYLDSKGKERKNMPRLWYARYCYVENEGHGYLKHPRTSFKVSTNILLGLDEIGEMLEKYKQVEKSDKKEKKRVIISLEKIIKNNKREFTTRLSK